MLLSEDIDLNKIQQEATPTFNFTGKKLGDIISALLPYIFSAAGLILLLYLIYGGIQLMLSQGDPKSIQAAQSKITNAVIGFIIIFLAYWLVQIVGKMLGIESFGSIFK
jgi:hypothetical protein